MSPNHAVYRVAASAPLLFAVVVVAVLAGAGIGDAIDALAGAVLSGAILGSALVVGVAAGAALGARAALARGRFGRIPARLAAAAHGAVPALAPAVVFVAMGFGGDWLAAWIAYGVPAFAFGAASALATLGRARDYGIVMAALGRGVPRRQVYRRHALPLALARAADSAGPLIGVSTAVAAVVERFAHIPGTGAMAAQAAVTGDAGAAAMAFAGLIAVAVAVDALAAGLAQRWLPRRGGA